MNKKNFFLENFLIKNVFEFSENSFSCSRRMGNAYKWDVERGGKGGCGDDADCDGDEKACK